jgi:hypothetical protein
LCTECWKRKFYTERGERLTMEQVRHRIGLTRPGTHETHRTRERTRSGTDDRNVTWPESQTPRSHRDVAQERRPVLHSLDTRFDFRSNERVIYCDGTCRQIFKKQGVAGFDGYYVTECPGTRTMKAWDKYYYQQQAYDEGTWDATWLCSACWQNKHYHEEGKWYTLTEVRQKLRISGQREQEVYRRQQRTDYGSRH